MRSSYLAAKIGFLVLALFTLTYQCAAQCVVEQCHDVGPKVPPCHRHNSTKGEGPAVCKASLLLAAEVRIEPSTHPEPMAHMLSFTVPELVTERALPAPGTHRWHLPEAPLAAEIRLTTPLRI